MWFRALLSLSLAASAAGGMQDALALEKAGHDDEALAALDAIIREAPAWELPRMEAGRLRLKLGRELERATLDLDIARAIAPENPRAHYLFGLAREEATADFEAMAAYRAALALRPGYDEARLRLAGVLFACGRLAEAEAEYRDLARRRPDWTQARLQWAVTLEQIGRVDEAEKALMDLRAAEPGSKLFLRKLAELYERMGRTEDAAKIRRELEPTPARKLRPLKKSRR
ncbi:MAG: tetratricopeptide repeat protein [Myxococcaceae bacterium]|nr:tetratricopeptide repeat protein [Myxococcaceae bacterium]